MSAKKTILVFIDWFWPGYLAGGPVQSLVSLVSFLGKDVSFKIITTNTDLNSTQAYPDIVPNRWITSPLGCEVFYASSVNKDLIHKLLLETTYDAVYINSFFSKYFSIVPLRVLQQLKNNKPVIVAPRGMLGEGALALKKWKKKLFITYARISGLHRQVIWHATSEQEAIEIKQVFPKASRIRVISNLPKKLNVTSKPPKAKGSLRVCFVSRISEKKNLLFALQVLRKITEGMVDYHIYGPIEDEAYWRRCQEVVSQLPARIRVAYKGTLNPTEVEATFAQYHFLFLPTMNENFGHAIVEALQCGCPVVISDQTPWQDVGAHRAGFALSLQDSEAFERAIKKCLDLSQDEFSEWSLAANKYISKRINLQNITEQYKQLFNDPT